MLFQYPKQQNTCYIQGHGATFGFESAFELFWVESVEFGLNWPFWLVMIMGLIGGCGSGWCDCGCLVVLRQWIWLGLGVGVAQLLNCSRQRQRQRERVEQEERDK